MQVSKEALPAELLRLGLPLPTLAGWVLVPDWFGRGENLAQETRWGGREAVHDSPSSAIIACAAWRPMLVLSSRRSTRPGGLPRWRQLTGTVEGAQPRTGHLTAAGMASSRVSFVVLSLIWYFLVRAVSFLRWHGRHPARTARSLSGGDRHLKSHEIRDNLQSTGRSEWLLTCESRRLRIHLLGT